MHGIVINIDPVIFHFGMFEIRWYSLAIMLAIVAAVLISVRQGKKTGIVADEIYSMAVWVVISGVAGARLFHVIDRWDYYSTNLVQIWQFQQGGLAIWGALAGGGLALLLYARYRRLSLGRLADTLVPGLLAGQMIGRLGCIVNGDAYGAITSLPWGFTYINPGASIPAEFFGVPTHPYPVYEIIWNAISLVMISRLGRYFKQDGLVFLTYLALYSLGRFTLTFMRQESQFFWGLQQAHIIALLGIMASLILITYLKFRRRVSEALN